MLDSGSGWVVLPGARPRQPIASSPGHLPAGPAKPPPRAVRPHHYLGEGSGEKGTALARSATKASRNCANSAHGVARPALPGAPPGPDAAGETTRVGARRGGTSCESAQACSGPPTRTCQDTPRLRRPPEHGRGRQRRRGAPDRDRGAQSARQSTYREASPRPPSRWKEAGPQKTRGQRSQTTSPTSSQPHHGLLSPNQAAPLASAPKNPTQNATLKTPSRSCVQAWQAAYLCNRQRGSQGCLWEVRIAARDGSRFPKRGVQR